MRRRDAEPIFELDHGTARVPLRFRVRRWFRELSLLPAVGLTLLGLFFFAAFSWFIIGFVTIGGFTWEITSSGITRSQAVQIALTMVGGAGAAVALVVTYRRHSRSEEGSFLERLGAAAAQLGDDKAAVQFSGVYALAALADESDAVRRQQVIDVLCGYLRLPYDPAISGHAGVQTTAEKTIYKEEEGGEQKETTVTTGHKSGEREVRATIFRVIRDHLQATALNSWSTLRFDFTGAVIDDCDLTTSRFLGTVSFRRAKFRDNASFIYSEFSAGSVTFDGAEFSGGEVSFYGARFSGADVSFSDALFSGGHVSFAVATFSQGRVSFGKAIITRGLVSFENAGFLGGNVSFFSTRFFGGVVCFDEAGFAGGAVSFSHAVFQEGEVSFGLAYFASGDLSFPFAEFSGGRVSFYGAHFHGGEVSFSGAHFYGGEVSFDSPKSWEVPPIVPWSEGEEPESGIKPRYWPPECL